MLCEPCVLSGAREYLEIQVPQRPVFENWRRLPREEEMREEEDDVLHLLERFKEGKWGDATLKNEVLIWCVQKLQDLMTSYARRLDLDLASKKKGGWPAHSRDSADRSAARCRQLLAKLKELKLRHFAQPASECRPRIIVVGPEGLGKSFTINAILHAEMKQEFPEFEQTRVLPSPLGKILSVFSPEPGVDMEAIRLAEEHIVNTVLPNVHSRVDSDAGVNNGPLPTSTLGATTGRPNQVHLDPSASCFQLKLVYEERAVIEEVLAQVEELRQQLRNTSDEARQDAQEMGEGEEEEGDENGLEEEMEVDDEKGLEEEMEVDDEKGKDVGLLVRRALAILGLKEESLTPIEQLERMEHKVELPAHLYALLGHERTWRIEASTGAQMAHELRQLLLLHTIGYWSRWPIIKSIEIVIPSARHDLHIWDIPGFGDKTVDPYRQQVVTEVIGKSCSSMLLLLDRTGGGNMSVKPYLEAAHVYHQLFGEERLRTVGKIVTVKAIDKQFQNRSLTVKNKEEIETIANESQQRSTGWMKTMIYQSMKVGLEGGLGGLQGNPKISAKQ
ncbi:MAG: hypothetical protein SGPRY_014169, partial [Prymnesium sp.]